MSTLLEGLEQTSTVESGAFAHKFIPQRRSGQRSLCPLAEQVPPQGWCLVPPFDKRTGCSSHHELFFRALASGRGRVRRAVAAGACGCISQDGFGVCTRCAGFSLCRYMWRCQPNVGRATFTLVLLFLFCFSVTGLARAHTISAFLPQCLCGGRPTPRGAALA